MPESHRIGLVVFFFFFFNQTEFLVSSSITNSSSFKQERDELKTVGLLEDVLRGPQRQMLGNPEAGNWKWNSCSCVPLFETRWTIYSPWNSPGRILDWAFPFSRGSSQPRDQTQVSHIASGFFTSWATREAQEYWSGWSKYWHGWSVPSPMDLPDPGIKLGSPELQEDIFYQLSYQASPVIQ